MRSLGINVQPSADGDSRGIKNDDFVDADSDCSYSGSTQSVTVDTGSGSTTSTVYRVQFDDLQADDPGETVGTTSYAFIFSLTMPLYGQSVADTVSCYTFDTATSTTVPVHY